jgi:hypothetical protein
MPQHVLAVYRIGGEPFPHHRVVHVVVVVPAFIAGVVRRIDKDAIHLARVQRQKGLERMQVVAMNDEIAVEVGLADDFFASISSRRKGTVRWWL